MSEKETADRPELVSAAFDSLKASVLQLLADRDALADALTQGIAHVLSLSTELSRLRAACIQSNDEICQKLGRALHCPMFKDDQKNFPGATEENGVFVGDDIAETMAIKAARRIAELERMVEGQEKIITHLSKTTEGSE